jgi:hypothetical protein
VQIMDRESPDLSISRPFTSPTSRRFVFTLVRPAPFRESEREVEREREIPTNVSHPLNAIIRKNVRITFGGLARI